MDKIRIRGGQPLRGRVAVSGSKNAVLPILAACLLIEDEVILDGVPVLEDVHNLLRLLESLGLDSRWEPDGSLHLRLLDEENSFAPHHLVRTMRASFCVLGPLWAKRGSAVVSFPGGCVFGHRPVDLHLKGLEGIGGKIRLDKGNVHLSGEVLGGQVYLGSNFGSTVLGTANVLMAAVLAKGETTIDYAAQEPEIADLCRFLNACGAKISGVGTHRLQIRGVGRLHGCRYRVIPDRIEAGTLLMAGLITGGEVEVLGARPDHLSAVLDRLRGAGAHFEMGWVEAEEGEDLGRRGLGGLDPARVPVIPPRPQRGVSPVHDREAPYMADRILYERTCEPSGEGGDSFPFIRVLPSEDLAGVDVSTNPYPGFPTDLQAQFIALMTQVQGVSLVTEKIYPERFIHVAELARLGAKIRREGPTAIVQGPERLSGATVMASDLRASAALILAGLVADGTTEVRRVYHLDRGYEGLEKKLRALGADIARVREQ